MSVGPCGNLARNRTLLRNFGKTCSRGCKQKTGEPIENGGIELISVLQLIFPLRGGSGLRPGGLETASPNTTSTLRVVKDENKMWL